MRVFKIILLPLLLVIATQHVYSASDNTTGDRPNVLLITVDDMNRDSIGAFGSTVKNITPNIDKLASEGMRFLHSHVTVAVCWPSRAV